MALMVLCVFMVLSLRSINYLMIGYDYLQTAQQFII